MIKEDWRNLFWVLDILKVRADGSVSLAETLDKKTKVVVKFIDHSKINKEKKHRLLESLKILRKI